MGLGQQNMGWAELESRAQRDIHAGTTPFAERHTIHCVAYKPELGADKEYWARWHAQTNSAVDHYAPLHTLTGTVRAPTLEEAYGLAKEYALMGADALTLLLRHETDGRPKAAEEARAWRKAYADRMKEPL